MTTTNRPACPFPCAGNFCPFIRSHSECQQCEHRPALDAWYHEAEAWDAQQAHEDHTGASDPYYSPILAGWGGGDR
jgi:hypothetical protein